MTVLGQAATLHGRLFHCVPGLVLLDFEWAYVVLDFHSVFSGACVAVALFMICGYSPRVRAVSTSGEPELAGINGLSGGRYNLELRLGRFFAVLLGAGDVQFARLAFEEEFYRGILAVLVHRTLDLKRRAYLKGGSLVGPDLEGAKLARSGSAPRFLGIE